jgi:hypothetical protein
MHMERSAIGNEGASMLRIHAAPLLLSLLVGVTLGLTAWGFVRRQDSDASIAWPQAPDQVLIGLLALAAFAIGAFVTYVLLIVTAR